MERVAPAHAALPQQAARRGIPMHDASRAAGIAVSIMAAPAAMPAAVPVHGPPTAASQTAA